MNFATLILLSTAFQGIQYPESKRTDFAEVLHGHTIADPYRWLEDANSSETQIWIAAQNKVTFGYLEKLSARPIIAKRFQQLFNFEKFGAPFLAGKRYFWTYNTGLQNQEVLYWSNTLRGGRKIVLLDPNKLSKDGTVALSGMSISLDGKWLAYSISKGGSDWQEWRIRSVDTGKDLPDKVEWSKFSGASWDAEGRGFYYARYDEPKEGTALQEQNYYHKLYYHRRGTPQSSDVLVYERKDQKEWGFDSHATEDGRYLIIPVWKGTGRENQIFYRDLRNRSLVTYELFKGFDAQYSFLGNVGSKFYFYTDKNAKLSRVVCVDIASKDRKLQTIVPEAAENLVGASLVGRRIFAQYLKAAYTQVRVYRLDGALEKEVKLPGIGSASGFAGRISDKETFYSFQSFGVPPTIFRYDIARGKGEMLWQPEVKFDPAKFETKQVFYKSKDGTRIPMFISHKKGLKLDGTNPTLLYGYGGFNSPMTPFFSTSRLLWMEMGGVSAVACLRGGGEYGNAWHDAGRLFKKQNVFDDFIAAAEHLIAQKYTSSARLAIQGGSNGGLLIGAVMNQRPDLFAVCLPEVGVMDMLRFHKFTIGWAWVSDYGNPEVKKDFEYLLTYSPIHNIKPGTNYPATLIITGDHDDRVVPAHSFKYAATLQHAQAGEAPVLIRIETQAGHGAGKPTSKVIEEIADKWAFAIHNMHYLLPVGFGR